MKLLKLLGILDNYVCILQPQFLHMGCLEVCIIKVNCFCTFFGLQSFSGDMASAGAFCFCSWSWLRSHSHFIGHWVRAAGV